MRATILGFFLWLLAPLPSVAGTGENYPVGRVPAVLQQLEGDAKLVRNNAAGWALGVTSNALTAATVAFAGNSALVWARYNAGTMQGRIDVVRLERCLTQGCGQRGDAVLRADAISPAALSARFRRGNGVVASGQGPFDPFVGSDAHVFYNVSLSGFLTATAIVMRQANTGTAYAVFSNIEASEILPTADGWGRGNGGSTQYHSRVYWMVAAPGSISNGGGGRVGWRVTFAPSCTGTTLLCGATAFTSTTTFVPFESAALETRTRVLSANVSRSTDAETAAASAFGPIALFTMTTGLLRQEGFLLGGGGFRTAVGDTTTMPNAIALGDLGRVTAEKVTQSTEYTRQNVGRLAATTTAHLDTAQSAVGTSAASTIDSSAERTKATGWVGGDALLGGRAVRTTTTQ